MLDDKNANVNLNEKKLKIVENVTYLSQVSVSKLNKNTIIHNRIKKAIQVKAIIANTLKNSIPAKTSGKAWFIFYLSVFLIKLTFACQTWSDFTNNTIGKIYSKIINRPIGSDYFRIINMLQCYWSLP